MHTANPISQEQAALWNGPSGQAWVETQTVLDQMFKPFENLLVDAVREQSAACVLDIGCGTGSTTLAVARLPGGHCTGVDISAPMLAAARARAARENLAAQFIEADAQQHQFEPEAFDMIMSRFGVMFFGDAVQAFTNLRRAVRKAAPLKCIAWRSPAENPFMTTAERAAAPLLNNLPARKPGAPGQFAFADDKRVRQILHDSGWNGIDIQAINIRCTISANDLMSYVTRLGPLGLALKDVDETTRQRVTDTVREAFEIFVHGDNVSYDAACWLISATS